MRASYQERLGLSISGLPQGLGHIDWIVVVFTYNMAKLGQTSRSNGIDYCDFSSDPLSDFIVSDMVK